VSQGQKSQVKKQDGRNGKKLCGGKLTEALQASAGAKVLESVEHEEKGMRAGSF